MKILFVTDTDINPIQGGTERITYTLSREFIRRGIPCHLAYYSSCQEPAGFSGRLKLEPGEETAALRRYIQANAIDSIIVNLVTIGRKRSFYPAAKKAAEGFDCRIFACFHAMAGEELLGNSPACALWRITHGRQSVAGGFKDIALRLTPKCLVRTLFRSYIRSRYRLLYDNCDLLVLLSERDSGNFASLAGIKKDNKFTAIGNALSFNEFLSADKLADKQREVLILSRMDERSKRISAALKIWKRVAVPGWKLVIVGSGPDLEYFRRMAGRMGLGDVCFEGRQPDAIPYYKRASVYMLTSSYEGWGISLTEAQQMGAVPIAFDSYPALPDVIDNGKNGVIVPDGDLNGYASALRQLMTDRDYRERLASEGLQSCRRFTVDKVVDRWMKILEKK